jgi:GT2 family glycosyltransferase
MNISLLVGLKNNLNYNKNFYITTRELYPEIEICFVSYGSTDGTHEWLDKLNDPNVKYFYSIENKTFSDTFNKASELATKDYVIYLHNDIILAPNFLENIEKHLGPNNVVSYTTIEPPIFSGHERPGKIIQDFGSDLQSFDKEKMYMFVKEKQIERSNKIEPGVTFFMCMPKKVLLEIGGMDNLFNPMFCEDDDLIERFKLIGMNMFASLDAICYHFVSKTSRFSEEYKVLTNQFEKQSNRNFVRKWGFRNSLHNKKYDIGFRIKKCNSEFLELLEPWCSNLLIDDEMQVLTSFYLDKEQPNTIIDLSKKIKSTPFEIITNEIIVEINRETFTNQDFQLIQQLPDIIKDNGSIGKFEIGNLTIEIKAMNEYQNSLIKL